MKIETLEIDVGIKTPRLEKALLDYRAKVVEMEFLATNAKRDIEFGEGFLFDYANGMNEIKAEKDIISNKILDFLKESEIETE